MSDITWPGILVGVISSVIGGFILLLLVKVFRVEDRVQGWLDRRALSNKSKRIEQLQQEYKRVKELHDNPTLLNLDIARFSIASLGILGILISGPFVMGFMVFMLDTSNPVINWSLRLFYIGVFIGFVSVVILFGNSILKFTDKLTRLRNFEKYEADVTARIEELQDETGDEPEVKHPADGLKTKLTIHSAKWGAKGKRIDVTYILKKKMSEDKLEMVASIDNLGDPYPGEPKMVEVVYSYGDHAYVKTMFMENEMILLPAPGIRNK